MYYVGLVLWAFGNFLLWYLTVLTARHTKQDGLVLAAMLVPIYWVMMSVAALKAMWQLVLTPSFWEKTAHGLDTDDGEARHRRLRHREARKPAPRFVSSRRPSLRR